MTIAYVCVLFAALMPIACAGIAKGGMFSVPPSKGGYDNGDPRAWLARQSGYRARANAAQANCFEALPFFIGAVLIAHQLHAKQGWIDALALVFIALRIVYVGLYLADRHSARSGVWTLALLSCVALLFVGAF